MPYYSGGLSNQLLDKRYINVTGDTFTGVSEFADGTSLLPSISFSSDTDTGIFRKSVNILSVTTGGVECVSFGTTANAVNNLLFVPSAVGNIPVISAIGNDTNIGISIMPKGTGNVGIGTTSAVYNLSVVGTDTKISATGSVGAAIHLTKTGTTNTWSEWQQTGLSTRLNASDGTTTLTDVMTILNTGNVGIGTATVAQKLTVNGGITAKAGLPGVGNTNGTGYSFSSPGDTDGGMFSTADGTLQLVTNSVTSITINSFGRVGIKNTNPLAVLDVGGTIRTSGSTVFNLPPAAAGMISYVTDALNPTFLGVVVGGGTVTCPVFHNGSSWICG